MNDSDEMLSRSRKWEGVSKLFKMTLIVSFLAACVAELMCHNSIHLYSFGGDSSRYWNYIVLMYLFCVPLNFIRVRSALHSYSFPSHRLVDRVFYTCTCIVMAPVMIGTPVLLGVFGGETQGRVGGIYHLMNSFFGLVAVGAFVFYGVSISMWILIFGIHGIWKKGIEL